MMTAADQVDEDDFNARSPEKVSCEFSRLACSFNLVEELECTDQQWRNLTAVQVDSPEYEVYIHHISPSFS